MVSQGNTNDFTGSTNIIVNESGTASHIENYKIVILGDQFVGKTSILYKYKYETVDEKYAPTVGIDFLTKNVFLEDKTIRLVMWDTAGSERFQSLIPSYLKNTQAIILTFDLTNKKSFLSLPNLIKQVSDVIPENVFMVLAGNKLDAENNRQVNMEEANEFGNQYNMSYIEVSAKTGLNITKLFDKITNSIFESNNIATVKDKTIILDNNNLDNNNKSEKKKIKCCK